MSIRYIRKGFLSSPTELARIENKRPVPTYEKSDTIAFRGKKDVKFENK